jgi:hypothetical protein
MDRRSFFRSLVGMAVVGAVAPQIISGATTTSPLPPYLIDPDAWALGSNPAVWWYLPAPAQGRVPWMVNKYGMSIRVSKEMVENDDLSRLAAIARGHPDRSP